MSDKHQPKPVPEQDKDYQDQRRAEQANTSHIRLPYTGGAGQGTRGAGQEKKG